MAKYVIAAGGNSNASGTWSNVSSASAGGDGVPAASDNVVLDSGSGQLTINAAFVCRSFECNNATTYTNTITHNSAISMTIGDGTAGANNIVFRLAGTYTLGNSASSEIICISTSATQQSLYCGGKTLGKVTLNSSSNGNYILGDTMKNDGTSALFTVTKGTFDSGNQTMTLTGFQSSNSNVRSVSLGSSVISVTTTFTFTTTTNLTWNAGTSAITCGTACATFAGGGLTWYDVTLNRAGAMAVDGANTFHNLTRTGSAAKTNTCTLSANQTVSNICTLASAAEPNRMVVQSDAKGAARTITAATITITNVVDFQDITGAGAGTWTVGASGATALGDCGGNSGITFTASTTQTATGTASFSWSTHGWTSHVPYPQDDVSVPNAFVAGRTITWDMPRSGRNHTFSCSGSPTLSSSSSKSVYGSWDSTGIGTISGSTSVTFEGRGSFTLTSAGVSWASMPIAIDCVGNVGTYTLADAFVTAATFTHTSGTFTASSFNFTTSSSFTSSNSNTRALNMGSGTWTFSGTGGWNTTTQTGLTYNAQTSTVVISNTSATQKLWQPAGFTFYNVTASGDNVQFSNAFTCNILAISNAGQATGLLLGAGATTTIAGLTCNWVSGGLALLSSTSAGTAATLSCPNTIDVDGLSVKDNTFSGGAGNTTAYCGPNGTLVSGTTNWANTLRPLPPRPPTVISAAINRAACI